jgi:hypothetical protein
LEIVDREKLLNGLKEPTDENLRYPVIARLDFPEDIGAHTAFPLLQVPMAEIAKQKNGRVKDFVAVTGETVANQCQEFRQTLRFVDISDEAKPMGVSTWTVPEASGNFCSAGGRFGAHSSNESFSPVYYNRILFIAHFQRRRSSGGRARPVPPEGDWLLHPRCYGEDGQALRGPGSGAGL